MKYLFTGVGHRRKGGNVRMRLHYQPEKKQQSYQQNEIFMRKVKLKKLTLELLV